MVYRGILAVTRDARLRQFAQGHLATEAGHLATIDSMLPPRHRSRLLPVWRAAGWLTGALPACAGPRAVYATIEAVETFVDRHYAEQIETIDRLDPGRVQAGLQALRSHLQAFQADEVDHREDAAAHFDHAAGAAPRWLRLWLWAVGAGSRRAVQVCRWI